MPFTIMLYGATGYSGRIITAEAVQLGMAQDGHHDCRLILAGRDGEALEALGDEANMPYRTFGLDSAGTVRDALSTVDAVINAAGPFAFTALPLVKAAIDTGCHYVDINGEVDVYKRLDDFADYARRCDVALVCAAGHMAAASDILLTAALRGLAQRPDARDGPLGAVRIALSRIETFSRGSGMTVTRSFREQVVTARLLPDPDRGPQAPPRMQLAYEPVGRLERSFDLGAKQDPRDGSSLRIASATNLVDTLTARLTVERSEFLAQRIESYMEAGALYRIGNQVAAIMAPLTSCKYLRGLASAPVELLPDGPTADEREREKHVVALEIEDRFREVVVDWRWDTPNVYQLTAQLVTGVAAALARSGPREGFRGWLTPSEVLGAVDPANPPPDGLLRGCTLTVRNA